MRIGCLLRHVTSFDVRLRIGWDLFHAETRRRGAVQPLEMNLTAKTAKTAKSAKTGLQLSWDFSPQRTQRVVKKSLGVWGDRFVYG